MFHENQLVLDNGVPLDQAHSAMIMVHGRGASAYDILDLSRFVSQERTAFMAPQAKDSVWYPYRFVEPIRKNEPYILSAFEVIRGLIQKATQAGVPTQRIMLLGFSQGACLTLEFAARHPAQYGGVFALSGALIENGDVPRDYAGSLHGTPVFLGCSDVDFHIPIERVKRSDEVMRSLGGNVTTRIYPNFGHSVNEDEIAFINETLKGL